MSKEYLNFTKTAIENLPIPTASRIWVRDHKVRGLALAILSSGTKSFYAIGRINEITERIYLGKFPDLTVENARKFAKIKLGQIAQGIDPLEERRKQKNDVTLGELYEEYMNRYSKIHKKSWKYDEREIPYFLSQWFRRKISTIAREEIKKRHEEIYLASGLYAANRLLERIRALYNKKIEWGWVGQNPATGIKKYKEKSRDRFVQPTEIPFLIHSLNKEQNTTIKDFLWMLLLTGARKTNTLMMRWPEINWENKQWRIPETKNGEPVIIPLTERAVFILKNRLNDTVGEWVFPQEDKPDKHLVNHKRGWARTLQRATVYYWHEHPMVCKWIKETAERISGLPSDNAHYNFYINEAKKAKIELPVGLMDIRLHDLRRTFGSYQALSGTSLQIIGKSLGHKSTQATMVYARLNIEAVRTSVDKATDLMFSMDRKTSSPLLPGSIITGYSYSYTMAQDYKLNPF